MLTLGNGFTVDNVTFFRDDEVKELFYYLPTKLQLVTAPDGTPAFQFTLYQIGLPIQGKEQGGGFLIFTVELTEEQNLLNGPAKQEATALLRNETPIGDPVPTPRFQTVPFIGGTANLLIPQGAGQLATTVQLSRPSLFGRNTVAVVADMPFGGAQVFADTLRQGGTIASIEYDLDFEVRLPAVVIEAFISASQVREVAATFVEDEVVDEDFWGGDTTTPVRHRTGYAETLEQHDLVQLSIKSGSSETDLDDEVVADLRDFALGAMNSYIENEWMAGTGGVLTEQQLQSEWLEFINEDFKRDFTLNMTQSDVVLRKYGASASISPQFVGADPKDFLTIVDTLAHPFFHRLTVPVSTSFDFAAHEDYVHSIVVSLHYSSRGADGRQVEKSESFIFSKDDTDPKTFITAKGRPQDNEFEVVAEVHYKNGPVTSRRLFSRRQVDPVVVVDVEHPGLLEVTFNAPDTAFEGELKAIEVEFEYADPANDVERFTESGILAKGANTVQIRHPIYTTAQRDFKYRFTHVFAQQRSAGPWLSGGPETKQLRVPSPFEGRFSVDVVASADWNEMESVQVSLRYRDEENDFEQSKSLNLTKADSGKPMFWSFDLRDPSKLEYTVNETQLLKNGLARPVPQRRLRADGSALIVGNAPGGIYDIEISAMDVAIGDSVRRVMVDCEYRDAANGVIDRHRAFFSAPEETSHWTIAVTDPAMLDYSYTVTYTMMDGQRRVVGPVTQSFFHPEDRLFLEPAPTG